jgi:PAS domain S-box-containing protein
VSGGEERGSVHTVGAHRPADAPKPDLARFLDLSAQILCITDLSSTVVWCNAAFEHALGYEVNELIGRRLDELLHPDDAATRGRATQDEATADRDTPAAAAGDASSSVLGTRVFGTGATLGARSDADEGGPVVLRLRAHDGRWRYLEWTTRLDLARERFYGVARDITDRRQEEAALSDSEARLQAILRYSPSAIFVKGLDGRYLLVNEEFCRAAGVSMHDVVGADAARCWPDDTETIAERERQLLAEGASLLTTDRLHTVDGPRDFMVHRFLMRDEDGEPYAIGGIASDISVRLGAERALVERDRLLDSVIRASPDMITLMDRAGKIHQISESESTMFGHPHAVFAETGLFEFVHPDDFDDVASMFVRMVTGGVSHLHLRYRVRHADGHWVVVDSRARAVLDAKGHFAGAVVVSRDVSDKLESEHKLKQSREAAEHASRAKSEFLSRMSHELRTPLNSILGFAQLLQMDELPPQSADAVEHILRAGRHLLDLIDEVLDIARIEAGHLELSLGAVWVSEIVAEAVELTSPIAARAEVTIHPGGAFGDQVVTADRQRLMQVLLNLLSNAVKYNHPGGRVDLSCRREADGFVRLSVADTGRGIRSEDLDRVFVPFDRIGAEQSGIEGTGVGLALSQHLCERMGGRLSVDSVAEVGTTFYVDLPAGDPAAIETGRSGRDAEGAAPVETLRGTSSSRSWIAASPGTRVVPVVGGARAGNSHEDGRGVDAGERGRRQKAAAGQDVAEDERVDVFAPHPPATPADARGAAAPASRGRDAGTAGPTDAPATTVAPDASERDMRDVRHVHEQHAHDDPDDDVTRDAFLAHPARLFDVSPPPRATVRPDTPGRTFRVLLIEDNLTTLDLVERVLSRRPGTEVLASMQGGLGIDLAREHAPDLVLLDLQLPDMNGNAVLDRLAEDPATASIPVAVVGADAPAPVVRRLLQQGIVGFLEKPIDVRGLLSLVDAVRAARGT